MRIKDWSSWQKSNEVNKDGGYGEVVQIAASLWASIMEIEILWHGKAVKDIAQATFRRVDDILGDYGLTGFQYGCLISLLSQVWEYGEDLRQWHNLNTQISTEGERANETGGVLNPALLDIETKRKTV